MNAFPGGETIYERNIATLNELGREGWEKLGIKPAVENGPAESDV